MRAGSTRSPRVRLALVPARLKVTTVLQEIATTLQQILICWTENLGMAFGSRKPKHFHDFLLFREMRIIASQIASFSLSCSLTKCKEFRATAVSGVAKQEKWAINRYQAKNYQVIRYLRIANEQKKIFSKMLVTDLFWVWCFFFFPRPCDQLLTQALEHALYENRLF